MSSKVIYREYLNHVQKFLQMDLADPKVLIEAVKKNEPSRRVVYNKKTNGFELGLVSWPMERVVKALGEIQDAIRKAMVHVAEHGIVSEEVLQRINEVSHDLKIRYFYDTEAPSHMKLGYHIPDSRIAWEEAKCPHCGVAVTLQIFPDPIPSLAYDAIVNLLRLLSRGIVLRKCGGCDLYFIPEKTTQRYHSAKCRKR